MLSRFSHGDKLFYGWIVVIAFLVIGTLLYGLRVNYGVFFKSIAGEFTLSRAETSSIYSAYMIFGCIFAFICGWALDRYGPRAILLIMGACAGLSLLLTSQANAMWQLFLTYSLLLSMGTGAMATMMMSTVSRWFDRRRGLAIGIAGSGSGWGQVFMAPFATYLILNFNWRIALIIIGLITWLIVIPSSRFVKKEPREIGAIPDGTKPDTQKNINEQIQSSPEDLSLLQAFRTRSFWLITFVWGAYSFCMFLLLTHLVPHVTDMGFTAVEAALVMSLIGGANIGGKVIFGIATDRMGKKPIAIISFLLLAGAFVWLLWARQLWMIYGIGLAFGLSWGGFSTSTVALVGDTFGVARSGAIFGALEIGFGLGAALGPAIAGHIFDVYHSYSLAFLTAAVIMFLMSFAILLIRKETN